MIRCHYIAASDHRLLCNQYSCQVMSLRSYDECFSRWIRAGAYELGSPLCFGMPYQVQPLQVLLCNDVACSSSCSECRSRLKTFRFILDSSGSSWILCRHLPVFSDFHLLSHFSRIIFVTAFWHLVMEYFGVSTGSIFGNKIYRFPNEREFIHCHVLFPFQQASQQSP